MATIDKLINALDRVNPIEVAFDVLKKDEDSITKLNKQQLLRGELSNGQRTKKHTYGSLSKLYVADKLDSGKISRKTLPHVNLFDEGRFYRGFKVLWRQWWLNIYSTDSKSTELQDTYGTEIFGLQPKSLDILLNLKKPAIQSTYKQKLRL